MIDGRRKGQAYMRAIAEAFAAWLGGTWRPRPTIAEPMEGWAVKGDLASHGVRVQPFVIEIKKIEGWVLDGLYDAPKWPVWSWWAQCKEQAASTGGIPLLIFSRNRRRDYILAPMEVLEWLRVKPVHGPVSHVRTCDESLGLCLLDDLVATRPPKSLPRFWSCYAGSHTRR